VLVPSPAVQVSADRGSRLTETLHRQVEADWPDRPTRS